jgi:hypothetical protein
MRPILCLTILAALGAIAGASPAAASTERFNAEFHDAACGDNMQCGSGVLQGFGKVTTTLILTALVPGPGDCLTVTAERSLTLVDDGSTLHLVADALVCGQTADGTFTVVAGTGVFAGADGSGILFGFGNEFRDAVHYMGELTLA